MNRLMQFDNEASLQEFMHQCLGGQREVTLTPGCRIDLRLPQYDIEIKPYLTKSALDKAAGQLVRYSPYSGGRKLIIAGCTPAKVDTGLERQVKALRDGGIDVWFVDQMDLFQNKYREMIGAPQRTQPQQKQVNYEQPSGYQAAEESNLFQAILVALALVGLALVGIAGNSNGVTATASQTKDSFSVNAAEIKTVSTPNGESLRLRSPSNETLALLASGDTVSIKGSISPDGYILVESKGQLGYAFAQYLQ